MNSRFKFPCRVRIHGGECGAVARALHHEVKSLSLPAVEKNVFFTTNERKQMSTKTTLKRIALVAVSALGFGVLTSVPSNATGQTPTAISFGSATGFRVGTLSSQTVTFTLPSGTAIGDTVMVLARVTSAPASSFATSKAAVPGTAAISSTASTSSKFTWAKASQGSGSYATAANSTDTLIYNEAGDGLLSTNTGGEENWTAAMTYTLTTGDSTTSMALRLQLNPDAAGSYNVIVALGTASSTSYDALSELEDKTTAQLTANLTTATTTISTGTTPSTMALAAVTTGAPKAGGALWKLTLDAGLSSTETIKLTSNSSTVSFEQHNGSTLTNATLTNSTGCSGTTCYFRVENTVAETATITATGSGLLSTSLTATGTVTHVTKTTTLTTQPNLALVTDTTAMSSTDSTAGEGTLPSANWSARLSSTSHTFTVEGGTEDEIAYATVTDTFGKITGKAGAVFDKALAAFDADGESSISISASLLAAQSFTVEVNSTTTTAVDNVVLTGRASTATTMTVANDTRRTASAGSTTFVATLKDQYGAAMANEVVNVSVSGRNATSASVAYTTNSLGQVSHTVTDAGTTGTSDTVTFTDNDVTSATDTGTILYGSATAGSVLVTTPNTTSTGADEYPLDPEDIAAGDGAEAGVKTVTALVKDADGNVLSGMLVTWTVTGTGCAILSTTATGYTGADGKDTASVYAWLAGTCTVTATSGGKSDDAPAIFAQEGDDEARSISATVSGNRITATVKDRFGNPVTSGVDVKATILSGTGYLGSASSSTAATDSNGQVTFVVSGGAASVKVGFTTTTFGQSDAIKGNVSSPTATDTLTAYTAGTATVAEEGVGASYDAAGVNSVTVEVTSADPSTSAAEAASDAAAEAIDAANAATDAANLAAEAADAATVAAEEARDAADAATAAVADVQIDRATQV